MFRVPVWLIVALAAFAVVGASSVALANCWEKPAGCEEWEWPEENCERWESPDYEALEEELEKGFELPEEEEAAKAEEEQKAGHDPILFVHGYNGNHKTFAKMVGWFEADGWDGARLYDWVYDWRNSNFETAVEIESLVPQIFKLARATKVDIITHSMGALSSRYYIKFLEGEGKVDEWVSLGGPNHGTTWASLCEDLSCIEMDPGSSFLGVLNAGDETPGPVNYGTWRSNADLIIRPTASVELAGAKKNVLVGGSVTHSGLHETKAIYEEVREFVKN